MIIKVLRGSKEKRILDWKLNEVSTYGILPETSEGGLRELIMNLIARGYMRMTVDQYPILKLNESSRAVLKGDSQILVREERVLVKDKKTKKKSHTNMDYDHALYDLLVDKRKAIASKKKVPLYVIFANAVLEALAYEKPLTKEEFLEIKGIGEKKYDSYGLEFIEIIKEYREK